MATRAYHLNYLFNKVIKKPFLIQISKLSRSLKDIIILSHVFEKLNWIITHLKEEHFFKNNKMIIYWNVCQI